MGSARLGAVVEFQLGSGTLILIELAELFFPGCIGMEGRTEDGKWKMGKQMKSYPLRYMNKSPIHSLSHA